MINLCLIFFTVCKNCIMRKVKEEKLKVCPECNTQLGVAPLQKIRPDHQVQGIRDMVTSKRRELIECGLIEKSNKGKPKKLACEDIDLNKIPVMLMDTLLLPPPLSYVLVGTSSKRKYKSTSSTINATPFVHDDQIVNQHNISSSSTEKGRGRGRNRGRGNGRGRGRRGCLQNDANVDRFQDPSIFNNVVDLNKGNTHPGSLTQHNQQVQFKSTLCFSHNPNSCGTEGWSFTLTTYFYPIHKDQVELLMLEMLIRPELPHKHLEKMWLRVAPHS
ncbi:hypothetical protein RDI58_000871 [Solanum bulbocastanum]|uniref:Uncharacterized protein n=1 Tax=Solanum bulbocastanum TaxID=147425 RepID=A0AAN8YSS1_SOLBU